MGINIEIHSVEDWEALYIDGKLHSQSHSDQLEEFVFQHFMRDDNPKPLTIDTFKFEYYEDNPVSEYVLRVGCFPETLSGLYEIRLEAKRELLRQKMAGVEEAQAEVDALKAEIEAMERTGTSQVEQVF